MKTQSAVVELATIVLIAGIAWGGFAFGAVYPWAYWPLAAIACTAAVAGVVVPAEIGWRHLKLAMFALSLVIFVAAAALQLIPLPSGIVRMISPDALSIVEAREFIAQQGAAAHPLSIAPAQSLRGLLVLASMAALVIGATRLLSIAGTIGIARAITRIGILMALTGIVQGPLFTGKVYGFWSPDQSGSNPFGPFVNRNHFAGWMLMAVPLATALLCSHISRAMHGERLAWRERFLWLASPAGNRLTLLIGAVALMTLSLILTMSRSGIAAGLVAIVATSMTSRAYEARRRRVAALVVAGLLVLVVSWAGAGTLIDRFGTGGTRDIAGRTGLWTDAVHVFRLYPLAGTGLNTYDVAMIFYQRFNRPVHYWQAHNDYLQLAAEGGLLLTIPALACVATFVWGVRRRFAMETSRSSYWVRRGAVVGIVAVALQEIVDFSLQMPGNAFLFAVLCAIALHRTPDRS